MALGLFPAVAGCVQQHISEPVLGGGATIVMFGTFAAFGVRIVSRERLNRRAIMIMALSLAVGMGVSQQPLILQFVPDWLKTLLSSGIAASGNAAIVLNLVFPHEHKTPILINRPLTTIFLFFIRLLPLSCPVNCGINRVSFLPLWGIGDEVYQEIVVDVAAARAAGHHAAVHGWANPLGGRLSEQLDQRQ